MRNSDRSVIGARVSRSWTPTDSRYAILPRRAIAATAPAILRSATNRLNSAVASSIGADARPTEAGVAREIDCGCRVLPERFELEIRSSGDSFLKKNSWSPGLL